MFRCASLTFQVKNNQRIKLLALNIRNKKTINFNRLVPTQNFYLHKQIRKFASNERFINFYKRVAKVDKTDFTNMAIFLSCIMIFTTIVLGGVTRKEKAGLSMTSWNFFGEKYPIDDPEWEAEFARYKQIPEYQLSDKEMAINDFKYIYWLEYVHRMIARGTGLCVLTASALLVTMPSKGDKIRAIIYPILIISQGFLGWYMVKSGFKSETMNSSEYPTVSAYRLSSHSALATILLVLMLSRGISGLKLVSQDFIVKSKSLLSFTSRFNHLTLLTCFLTIISGSYTAGTHSGLVHNTFPSMSGSYVPDDILHLSPKWRNIFENQATIQFIHRNMAYLTMGMTLISSLLATSSFSKLPYRVTLACASSSFLVLLQIMIGAHCIMTCTQSLSGVHQANSIITMSSLVWLATELAKIKKGVP